MAVAFLHRFNGYAAHIGCQGVLDFSRLTNPAITLHNEPKRLDHPFESSPSSRAPASHRLYLYGPNDLYDTVSLRGVALLLSLEPLNFGFLRFTQLRFV